MESRRREWLVYSNATYYPDAVIVEAETAEQAARVYLDPDAAIIVMPFDPDSGWVSESIEGEIDRMRENGREQTAWADAQRLKRVRAHYADEAD